MRPEAGGPWKALLGIPTRLREREPVRRVGRGDRRQGELRMVMRNAKGLEFRSTRASFVYFLFWNFRFTEKLV